MNLATRAASFCLVILAAFPAVSEADTVSDQQLLSAAKATRVSQIEPGLPNLPVEAWLSSLAGPAAALSWELNDCGEQIGVPEIDGTRDLPVCAELEANIARGRSVYLYFVVGTRSKGVVLSRSLYLTGVVSEGESLTFPSLSALAAYLRRERER